MDDDTRHLIRRLYTRAGMIMADARIVALVLPSGDGATLNRALDHLQLSSSTKSALIDAALALANDRRAGNQE